MASLTALVSEIISELKAIQNKVGHPIDKGDPFQLPRMIGVGDGNGIVVSQKVDQLIATVSKQLIANDPSLARKVTDDEWNAAVRAAFGPHLAKIDLDDDLQQNAKTVLDSVQVEVKSGASAFGSRELGFACTLFSTNTKISEFEIGPARFEPRLVWLKRKTAEGFYDSIHERRIVRAWNGEKLSKRKKPLDNMRERDVLDTVGSAPYVCSVSVAGLAAKAGTEKALTAARLALTSIALLWETPSKALEGFNLAYDRSLHTRKSLSFAPGVITLAGGSLSHMPHGPYLKAGEWEELFASNKDYFDVVGEVLEYFLNASGSVPRPKMMNTLGQALLWFHEGCRDPVTVMAVVNFAASLDALGGGRKAGGILAVISARLGLKSTDPIRPGGPTAKETIDRIYSDGRSRTIHGTNDKLGHDWSPERSVAEQFARMCLLACIDWAAQHKTSDDPAQLKV